MSKKWSPEQRMKFKATMASKRPTVPKVYSNVPLAPAVTVAANDPNDAGYKQAVRDLLPLLERLTR